MADAKTWHECNCPKCGSQDKIDVVAQKWVRLTPDGSDADESHDGSDEYDGTSLAMCMEEGCGHSGLLSTFGFGS